MFKNLLKKCQKNHQILLHSRNLKRKIHFSTMMNKKKILILNPNLKHQSKRKARNNKRNLRFLQKNKMMIQHSNLSQSPLKNKFNRNQFNNRYQSQNLNLLKSQKDHFLLPFLNNKMRKVQEFSLLRNLFNQNLNQFKKLNKLQSLSKMKNQMK